ncbi:uncharacterized protein LOC127752382 [Frankliniella occidentalis]|uniref:Uncharacterized protein LOC127752382 n=1 Tax=Frankliniella occidentalis TaxID=133901 RepID=A0A9C6XWN6_FRAOC|nr:uncharacterized protein LOC127752382 [Frankliniella occidentalis]
MQEVKGMTALKRLSVKCDYEMDGYPDLPFQLEELAIFYPCKSHLYNVQCMPGLRSLLVEDYLQDGDVAFPRPMHGGLLWLSVALNVDHRANLRSLLSAHAQSLQELQIYCGVNDGQEKWYFPDLPELLGTCGFQALRRLVLVHIEDESPCEEVDACLLQRRAIRKLLPPSVDVICKGCPGSVF